MAFPTKPPLQAGDAGVLLPSDLFFFQQRAAFPTIAGARASGPGIIDTSPEKTPQMDEKASLPLRPACCTSLV